MQSSRHNLALFLCVVATSLVMSACDSNNEAEQVDEADQANRALEEEGDDETIELTFAFQPQENPDGMQLDVERFGEFITEETGYEVEIFLPTNYAAVVEALRAENADVAYFSGLPYLIAHEEAGVELLVVEERDGNPYYYSQWYTQADSDIEELSDLEGRSIAFTSPTSTSGYLFPMAELIDQELLEEGGDPATFFGNIIFAGGYEQALMGLVHGRVDAAAASDYALEQYISEEDREKIRVVTRQGPVPTHGLAIRSELPEEVKTAVRDALLKLNDEEHTDLLKSVYGAERLVERDHDEHVSALKHAREVVDFEGSF